MRKMWEYRELLRGRRFRLKKEREVIERKIDQLTHAHTKMETFIKKKQDAITGSVLFIIITILIYIEIRIKL